jgi:hypothetical protein
MKLGARSRETERQPEVGDRRRVAAATNGRKDQKTKSRSGAALGEAEGKRRDEESNEGKRCEGGNVGRGIEAERR